MGLKGRRFSVVNVSRKLLTALALVAVGLVWVGALVGTPQPAQAAAGINQQINFQGRLLTTAGAVVADGNYNMEFQIWQGGNGCVSGCTSANANTNNGGTLKWTEDWIYGTGSPDNRVAVKNGYYSVSLGSITAFGSNVDWNQDTLWLSMNVGDTTNQVSFTTSGGYLIPFKRLSSAVYALQANSCTTCILQAPTSTAQNTITPTTNSVTALTVNGTSGTAATALAVTQTGNAAALTVGSSGGGDGEDLTVSKASGTTVAGLSVANTGAGTVTSGLSFTNSGGGAITADIKLQNAETIDNATNGTVNISADTPASNPITLKLTGTAATIQNSAGNLSVTATSALNLTGAAASTWSTGANSLTLTSSNFNVSSVGVVTLAGNQAKDITTAAGTTTNSAKLITGDSSAGASGAVTIQSGNATGGTAGTVTVDTGTGGTSTLALGTANAGTINIANNNATHTIAIGNGATGVNTTTLGTTNSTSTTTIQGGTGTIALLTGNNGAGTAGNITLTTGTSTSGNAAVVVKSLTNSTQALQVVNSSGNQVLNVDTTNNTVSLGKSTSGTGILSFLNSGAGSNAFTIQAASGGAAQQWTLPSSIPGATTPQCLQESSGNVAAVTLAWGSCGGGASTLQAAYAGSSSPATITLNSTQNGIIISNPSSGGTSSAALLSLSNSATGSIDGLDITSAGSGSALNISSSGTGNLLKVTDSTSTAADVLTIADGGAATFKSQTNSTTAFQVQNSNGASLLTVDDSGNNISLLGNHASALGTWTTTTAMSQGANTLRDRGSSVAYNGYLYYIGGVDGTGTTIATVEYAKIKADGTLDSTWNAANAMPGTRREFQATVANGYLYVIGGIDNSGTGQPTAYYAKIKPDGSLGTWGTTTALGTNAGVASWGAAVVAYNGYIWYIGGFNNSIVAQTQVLSAKANPDGTLGNWTSQTALSGGLSLITDAVVANGYVYLPSGDGTTSITHARLNTDGTVGSWSTQTSMLTTTALNEEWASYVANGYLYEVAADGGTAAQSFALNADGSLAAGTSLTAFPVNGGEMGFAQANGYFYALGGNSATDGSGTSRNTVYYTSAPRVTLAGNLDLVALSGTSLVDGGSGGQLAAGNTTIAGTIQVSDVANFMQSVYVGNSLSVAGSAAFKNNSNSATAFQVQNASGATLVNINTNNSNINSYAAGALGVTGSAPTGVSEVLQSTYAGTPSATTKDLGVAPHAIGNIMILTVAIANNTTTVSSIGATNNGGVSNWTLVKSNNYSGWNATGSTVYIYEGVVTNVGCGTVCNNVRVTFNTTDSVSTEIVNQEMSSGLGAGTTWSVTASGSATQTGASTTIPFPTLTSGVSGGLYYGYSFLSSTARIDPGSSGFHWFATPTDSNAVGYNLALSPNTSYSPSQLSSANTYANSIGAIITATADNSLGVNGSALIAGPGSTAAFQVQNSTGAADLNVDTTNHVISLDTGNTGDISPWQYNSDSTGNSSGEGQNVAVAANGYVYDLTGYDNGSINGNTYYAKASSNGQLGHMSTTTVPTTHVVNQGAVVVNGYVYELGGSTTIAGTATVSNVQYAQINPDGTLGTWQTTTALPSGANGVAGASVVAANGYIYVIGGYFNTTMTAAVYYGKVNADGSVTSWTTSANSLPVALRYTSAVYVNGNILVMGGTTGSGSAVQTVYTASVNASTGANSAFSSTGNATLPSARAYASASVVNGYVYLVGGSSTDAATSYSPLNSTVYGQINSFGNVAAWSTSGQQLPQTTMWHGGVTMNGYLYVIGGYYTSTPNYSANVFFASTARVLLGGSLDLVGDGWATLADGGDQSSGSIGGYLTAGNTEIVGTMQVANQAEFNQGVTVNGNFNNFGSTLFKDSTASSTAFQVQNTSNATVLGVDTSANKVLIGSSGLAGNLVVYSGTSTNAVTISNADTTGSYNLVLPSSAPSANKCLAQNSGNTALTWIGCASTKTITLMPEFPGAVFTANSGSGANTGYMQSDHTTVSSGYTHNYYQWSTDQSSAQDYDIVTEYQVPSDFNSPFVSNSFKAYVQVDSTTSTSVKVDIKDGATDCYASGFTTGTLTTSTTWAQQTLPNPDSANGGSCTIAANDILTIDFRLTAIQPSTNWVRLGYLTFQY